MERRASQLPRRHARLGLVQLESVGATLAASEAIEIEVAGDYRVRVGSGFDGHTLKCVLDVLSRAGGAREKGR